MDTRQPVNMYLRQVSSSIVRGIWQIPEKKIPDSTIRHIPPKGKQLVLMVGHTFSPTNCNTLPVPQALINTPRLQVTGEVPFSGLAHAPSLFNWEATQSCGLLLQMFSGQKVLSFACLSQHLVDFNTNSYSEKLVKSDLHQKLCSHRIQKSPTVNGYREIGSEQEKHTVDVSTCTGEGHAQVSTHKIQ